MATSSLPFEWLVEFDSRIVPVWLEEFVKNPQGVVESTINGTFNIDGRLTNDDTVAQVALSVRTVGEQSQLALQLDELFEAFLVREWPSTIVTANLPSRDWVTLFKLLSSLDCFPKSAALAMKRFDESYSFLFPLSQGRALDPYWFYLATIARYQTDESLRAYWWYITRLASARLPFYYGQLGLEGLRYMPHNGRFPQELPAALSILAQALAARAEAGMISTRLARREFRYLTRRLLRLYPQMRWWNMPLAAMRIDNLQAADWINELFPAVSSIHRTATSRRTPEVEPHWLPEIRRIEQLFVADANAAVREAGGLILKQEFFVRRSGNCRLLVRTLCNFSNLCRSSDPGTAVRWAADAREWDETNPYTWTALALGLYDLGNTDQAIETALAATQLFPYNEVVWTVALRVCVGTDNEPLWSALLAEGRALNAGSVSLKIAHGRAHLAAGDTAAAREILSPVFDREEGNPLKARSWIVAGLLLGRSLERDKLYPEAKLVYERLVYSPLGSDTAYARLAWVHQRLGNVPQARDVLVEGLGRFPDANAISRPLIDLLTKQEDWESLTETYIGLGRLGEARTLVLQHELNDLGYLEVFKAEGATGSNDEYAYQDLESATSGSLGSTATDTGLNSLDWLLVEDIERLPLAPSAGQTAGMGDGSSILGEGAPLHLRPQSVDVRQVVEVRLLRRRASRAASDATRGSLLDEAWTRLRWAESISDSASLAGERAMLTVDGGDYSNPLLNASDINVGAPFVLLAQGRALRESVRVRLTRLTLSELMQPYRRLCRDVESLLPVLGLAEVRAHHALEAYTDASSMREQSIVRLQRQMALFGAEAPSSQSGEFVDEWKERLIRALDREEGIDQSDEESRALDLLIEEYVTATLSSF